MRLSEFICHQTEGIEQEWDAFARKLTEFSKDMDVPTLRDHLREILAAMAHDMEMPQSVLQQSEKSQGFGPEVGLDRITMIHARMRVDSGFALRHIIAEYRALRASILRLYAEKAGEKIDPLEITRFNETIDQAVAEILKQYEELSTAYSTRLIGMLVHDIRTPLGTIGMNAQILGEQGADAATLARVARSVGHVQRLIDDLEIFIRSRFALSLPITRTECDLGLICEQTLEDLHSAYPDKVFTFSKTGNLRGKWDQPQLVRVVLNLGKNAAVHGTGQDIRVDVQGEPSEVILSVSNQGKPIPADQLNSIFRPLLRAATEPTGSRSQSFGLGLFIVHELVKAHDGTVTVTSSKERGTIFTVRLPR